MPQIRLDVPPLGDPEALELLAAELELLEGFAVNEDDGVALVLDEDAGDGVLGGVQGRARRQFALQLHVIAGRLDLERGRGRAGLERVALDS